jgi:Ig-like domain CHU_C associated
MLRARMILAAAVVVVSIAAGAYAQPSLVTINSSPLQINVAGDASFQVYNNIVPGVGQIFPTGSDYGDFGVFAEIDGALFAPDFGNHSGGSATGALGEYTSWQQVALSGVSGDGSPSNPYTVSVSLAAPGTDVRATIIVTHVRGNNFFRLRSQFFSTQPHVVNAFVGADIYLAGSDNGIFVSVPALNAVGGRNCDAATGEYNILLIPITQASRFTTGFFSQVWSEIGSRELSNFSGDVGCTDNGAAVQWNDIMRDSTSVEVAMAVSFGEVPSPANFFGFFVDPTPDALAISPGQSVSFDVKVTHNEELGFNAPVTLSAPELPQGMRISFAQNTFPAPGDGTTRATLTIDSSIFPQLYRDVRIVGTGGGEVRFAPLVVDVLCDPPVILGINQPQSVTVARNATATLTVKPESAGVTYQWYRGYAPLTFSPIAGASSATFTTGAVTEQQEYWVRVSNPCGTVDSGTAIVRPSS